MQFVYVLITQYLLHLGNITLIWNDVKFDFKKKHYSVSHVYLFYINIICHIVNFIFAPIQYKFKIYKKIHPTLLFY